MNRVIFTRRVLPALDEERGGGQSAFSFPARSVVGAHLPGACAHALPLALILALVLVLASALAYALACMLAHIDVCTLLIAFGFILRRVSRFNRRPLVGLQFAALTWFQGEANVGPADSWHGGKFYSCQLPLMLKDWRKQLELPEMPVLVVELSAFCNEYDDHTFLTHCDQRTTRLAEPNTHLPALRLAQSSAQQQLDNVLTISGQDLGALHPTLGSIHSSAKVELGVRLARGILATAVYASDDGHGNGVVWEGPKPLSAKLENVSTCSRLKRSSVGAGAHNSSTSNRGHGAGAGAGAGAAVLEVAPCVRVTFGTMVGSGDMVLNHNASCPMDGTGARVLLPFYCNSSETDGHQGAGFELYDGTTRGWSKAVRATRVDAAAEEGSDRAAVVLEFSLSGAAVPTRVRYAYADWPVSAVTNGAEGFRLPARIFDIAIGAEE